jgi:hypothetical protein
MSYVANIVAKLRVEPAMIGIGPTVESDHAEHRVRRASYDGYTAVGFGKGSRTLTPVADAAAGSGTTAAAPATHPVPRDVFVKGAGKDGTGSLRRIRQAQAAGTDHEATQPDVTYAHPPADAAPPKAAPKARPGPKPDPVHHAAAQPGSPRSHADRESDQPDAQRNKHTARRLGPVPHTPGPVPHTPQVDRRLGPVPFTPPVGRHSIQNSRSSGSNSGGSSGSGGHHWAAHPGGAYAPDGKWWAHSSTNWYSTGHQGWHGGWESHAKRGRWATDDDDEAA